MAQSPTKVIDKLDHYLQRSRYKHVTICPCCGFKFEGDLTNGCEACGARSVGEPLPKPEHELPSYARSLVLFVMGSLMVLTFLIQTVIALLKDQPISFGFWQWVTAAQTAAWHLKWAAIPVTILVLWGGRKLYGSMLQSPERFCGVRYARVGFVASAATPLLIALLIGITVPERLYQRQLAVEAAINAQGYAYDRLFNQYLNEFKTMPSDVKDLARLPDPDGSIAAFLKSADNVGYKASSDVAVATISPQPPTLSGSVIKKASLDTSNEKSVGEGLAFTNYELRLPGPDKILNNEDDLLVTNGVITKVADSTKPIVTRATTPAKP